MNLREKTLIIVGATLLLLVVILYATALVELRLSFTKLEENISESDVNRALGAISHELTSLNDLASYWASRNDTYAFLESGDPSFINRDLAYGSLSNDSLRNMRINIILFMDSYGQNVFGRYLNANWKNEKPPEDLKQQLSVYGFCPGCLDKYSKSAGIILLSNKPMLIVVSPVTDNEKDGQSVGRVILGRYLTAASVRRLSETTQLNLTLYPLQDSYSMPADFREVMPYLSSDSPLFIRLIDEDSIAGYALLSNIYGNPLMILRVDAPRSVYRLGMRSLTNFIILFSTAGLIFLVMTLVYLDRSVLSRMNTLTTGIASIGMSKNIAERLTVKGKDELYNLAASINSMLNALEEANYELIKSEKRYKAVVEEQPDLIVRTLTDGTITFANDAFTSFFSIQTDELLGNKIDGLIFEGQMKPTEELMNKKLNVDRPTFSYESKFIRQGRWYWILWTSRGIFSESGTLIEIQSVGRDVTELKVAGEALMQSERRLSDIIDFMPDALLAIDLDGNVIVWNKAMEVLTGVRAEEMMGKGGYEYSLPFYGFRRPILVDMVLGPFKDYEAEYANYQKDGATVIGETYIPTLGPNGSYLLAKAAALYNAKGDVVGAIESIRDLTERRLMEQKLERTKAELYIAADIQKSFIPDKTPEIPEFQLAAQTIPAMEVGGDFYDFILQSDGKYGMVIADVAGKSIPAALIMALSRTIIRANATNQSNISEVLKNANKMIAFDVKSSMFVTLLYGVIDGKALTFQYANAGHPPPLLFRSRTCMIEEEKVKGIALGVVEDASYEVGCIEFSSGDIALFYTDGVTESMNSKGEMYGLEKLARVISRSCQLGAKEIMDEILMDISNFCGDTESHDDITLLILKAREQMENHFEITISAKEEEVSRVISLVNEIMSPAFFEKKDMLAVQLAIEEACVNIIRHGYRRDNGNIFVAFDFEDDVFKVTIEDKAPPFDPLKFDKPNINKNLDERPIGGLGIHIIKSLISDLKYEFREHKNRLVMKIKTKTIHDSQKHAEG